MSFARVIFVNSAFDERVVVGRVLDSFIGRRDEDLILRVEDVEGYVRFDEIVCEKMIRSSARVVASNFPSRFLTIARRVRDFLPTCVCHDDFVRLGDVERLKSQSRSTKIEFCATCLVDAPPKLRVASVANKLDNFSSSLRAPAIVHDHLESTRHFW